VAGSTGPRAIATVSLQLDQASADGSSWAVAHERPDRHVRKAMGVIGLSDMAIAASGNYRRWFETDNGFVSHTIQPERGRPLDSGVASVSVMAPSCMSADACATALLVAGADEGTRLAQAAGIEAILSWKTVR